MSKRPSSGGCNVPAKKARPNTHPHRHQGAQQQGSNLGCQSCETYKRKTRLQENVVLDASLEELAQAKKTNQKGTALDNFLQHVNAFLNSRGGFVIIHADNLNQLDLFYQKIDDKLQRLIPPDAFYHEYFKCYFLDSTHCAIRVRIKSENRPVSTLDYKTKLSVSKGVVDPSYCQMVEIMKQVSVPKSPEHDAGKQTASHTDDDNTHFIYKDELKTVTKNLLGESVEVPLRESTTVQVKTLEKVKIDDLAEVCWDFSHKYIPAFSRIPGGGSVYLGVGEEKREENKWKNVTSDKKTKDVLTVNSDNKDWEVWTDKTNGPIHVYYVAKESPQKETRTGRLIATQHSISQETAKLVEQSLIEKVNTKMKWIGKSKAKKPIEVKFHSVKKQPCQSTSSQRPLEDKSIIEVKVNYYHGICFYCPSGPELYRFPGAPGTKPAPVSCKNWLEQFTSDISPNKSPASRVEIGSPSVSAGTSACGQKSSFDLHIFDDVIL